MARLEIEIWSDIACPWCFVGKRRLEGALGKFPHSDEVAIRWRSFELDPSKPKEVDRSVPIATRLARKYGTSVAQAERMIDHLTDQAASDGIEMRIDIARSGNTFDAHRVVHLAWEHGCQDAVKERLLRGYLCEGELVSDHETLIRLAADAGLPEDEVAGVLATDAYADEVRRDEAKAAALGIHGVPCFVLAGRFAVSGAQPVDTMLDVLGRAWAETAGAEVESLAPSGVVCGPDGCA